MTDRMDFKTPVGRLVQGDLYKPQTTDHQGNPLRDKAGNPAQRWFFALAIEKANPELNDFFQILNQAAQAGFPRLFQNGQCTNPNFSWKMIDGDGVDANGKPNSEKEGFAGHWVFRFSSGFPPSIYDNQNPPQQMIQEGAVKRGHYIRVYGSTSGNGDQMKPGIYLNHQLVQFVGYGPEIKGGPDGATVFGGTPVGYTPAGMSTAPVDSAPVPGGGAPATPGVPGGAAPAPAAAPATPGTAGPAPVPGGGAPATPGTAGPAPVPGGGAPATPGAPGAAPAAAAAPVTPPTAPATDFVPGGDAPAAPGAASAPAAPAGPQMTAAAGGVPYEAFKAQGWTDEALRAHGYMV